MTDKILYLRSVLVVLTLGAISIVYYALQDDIVYNSFLYIFLFCYLLSLTIIIIRIHSTKNGREKLAKELDSVKNVNKKNSI